LRESTENHRQNSLKKINVVTKPRGEIACVSERDREREREREREMRERKRE
jgi:hypothetical protein